MARLGGEQVQLASKAAQDCQGRIDTMEASMRDVEKDIEKCKDEVGVLHEVILSLELATAFIQPKNVFPRLPTEFRALPIQVSGPCPFCDRYFVDTTCVPLTCGCLAHPHCMFQLVFSLDGKCRRCERAVTGGWLGQWGFPLNETA